MELAAALTARRPVLPYYSPYHSLRGLSAGLDFGQIEEQHLRAFGQRSDEHRWQDAVGGTWFLYQHLAWDSTLAGVPVVRVRMVLFADAAALAESYCRFADYLTAQGVQYAIMEVPAEDTQVLQAAGKASWTLIETRLQYAHENRELLPATRHPVRLATLADQSHIGAIARTNVNSYDRFHADSYFTPTQADNFLEAYGAATVAGYCDEVLVPAEPETAFDSFLAIKYSSLDDVLPETKLARIMLTAVRPANRGWHRRLVAETLHRAYSQRAQAVLMTTQATNRAVVRNAEQLGFYLGAITHTFSWTARHW